MPRATKAELARLAALVEQKIDAAEAALNAAHDALGDLMERAGLLVDDGRLLSEAPRKQSTCECQGERPDCICQSDE